MTIWIPSERASETTAGVRTTVGSKILADRVPTEDATVVRRLARAGPTILESTSAVKSRDMILALAACCAPSAHDPYRVTALGEHYHEEPPAHGFADENEPVLAEGVVFVEIAGSLPPPVQPREGSEPRGVGYADRFAIHPCAALSRSESSVPAIRYSSLIWANLSSVSRG